jgi:hypothetical protein
MGAHRFVRFTKFELELREAASKTLADPAANIAEERHARRVLGDTLSEAQGRHVMAKTRKVLGPKPTEPGPTLDAWRDELKRIKANAILDDPRSSLAQTRLAERTLKEIEIRERQRGAVRVVAEQRDAKSRAPVPEADGPSLDVQPLTRKNLEIAWRELKAEGKLEDIKPTQEAVGKLVTSEVKIRPVEAAQTAEPTKAEKAVLERTKDDSTLSDHTRKKRDAELKKAATASRLANRRVLIS